MLKYVLQFRPRDIFDLMLNGHRPQLTSDADLTGKHAVISGATHGIGLTTARKLASKGCGLTLICRNPELAGTVAAEISETSGADVRLLIADYTDLETVRRAADELMNRREPIDILINNAGVHSTVRKITEPGIEQTFCVDHLAHFLLTFRLLPKLKSQKHARIINVNSEGHRFSRVYPDDLNFDRHRYTGLRGYGAAKTAQLLTSAKMAKQLAGTGVTVNCMHPGAVHSNVGTHNGKIYQWFYRHFLSKMLKDNAISAKALYVLASSPDLEDVSGKFFNLTRIERPAPHALDEDLGEEIWRLSLQLTGLE